MPALVAGQQVGLPALKHQRDLRPVVPKPLCGIRLADDALNRGPGGVLERLVPQPGGRIVYLPMRALVAWARLECSGITITDPTALREASCECDQTVHDVFVRLLPYTAVRC
jgi:hypothetical protein